MLLLLLLLLRLQTSPSSAQQMACHARCAALQQPEPLIARCSLTWLQQLIVQQFTSSLPICNNGQPHFRWSAMHALRGALQQPDLLAASVQTIARWQ
jgi:hypothetical protein